MRNHKTIVKDAGTPELVSDKRGVSVHTVRSWMLRDSIPSEHWAGFAADGWASLEELALSAEQSAAKRRAEKKAA